ncbi:MAG: hypothetical protein GXO89_08740 [Chlorobi bacterium]|nr:hypothetical protein [Chlorobiota bacterium]
MNKILLTFLIIFQINAFGQNISDGIFKTENGKVVFTSDAPLELISAES